MANAAYSQMATKHYERLKIYYLHGRRGGERE